MTDLASAYGMIQMQVEEREQYDTEEEYFTALYGIELQKLADIFASFVSDKFTLDSAFMAASFMYELGRKHEQVIQDTPTD